jgi:hypothetical protein
MNAEIVARLDQSLSGATVVLPTEMRRRVEAAAKKNSRDFAGELWQALEKAYPAPKSRDEQLGVINWLIAAADEEAEPGAKQKMLNFAEELRAKLPPEEA